MKQFTKYMIRMISFILLLTATTIAQNRWVPIMMGDITTFVPYKITATLTPSQRYTADQIISIFENNTTVFRYDYAEIVEGDEAHGITAGRLGFTSATGDMLDFFQSYYHHAPFLKYIEELERLEKLFAEQGYEVSDDSDGSMNVDNLVGLIEDWHKEGKKEAFQKAQDRYLDEHYYTPAMKVSNDVGLSLPLSLLCFYDTAIQHGVEGLKDIVSQVNLAYPTNKEEELKWIKQFNQKRIEVLKSKSYWEDTLYRVETLNDLIKDKKYYLNIDKIVIRAWGDEEFVLLHKTPETKRYHPTVDATWHIQLNGDIDTSYNVDIYDIDLFDTSKKTIALLHNQEKKVICYFSAGSYEDWREDAKNFPKDALGKKLDGWEGERWLDVRNHGLKSIMLSRMDLAKEKGCDGVDPDNVDGYTNDTGFPLTKEDQKKYNKFLAKEAHNRGLAVGLKNNLEQIKSLVKYYDFAVNEQCNEYNECSTYKDFIDVNKPVLNLEYESTYKNEDKQKELCQKMDNIGIYTLIMPLDLDASFRIACQ